MALETGTYLSDLVATNPAAADPKSQGDDHIRLLKSTIKATLPNLAGAVSATHTELSFVSGVTSAIQTQITAEVNRASAAEALLAPKASPALTGTPTAPTATPLTNTTQLATTAYTDAAVAVETARATSAEAGKAALESPAFTGTPTAPTAAAGTNTTQLATTAFVQGVAMTAALPAQAGNGGKFVTTNGANASWAAIPPPSVIRSARTANTILTAANSAQLIDCTTGGWTQTFDAAAMLGNGWYCYLKNSSTGDITLDPNLSETIDGLLSFIMYPGEVRLVQCDGTGLNSVVLSPFYRVFTTSGTFIKPPGYLLFEGCGWGAGGGGGKSPNGNYIYAGGGGGFKSFSLPSSVFGASEFIAIGSGGLGQTTNVANATAGGASAVGALITFPGAGGATGGAVLANGTVSDSIGDQPQYAYYSGNTLFSGASCTIYSGGSTMVCGSSVYGAAAGGSVTLTTNVAVAAGFSVHGGNGGAFGDAISGSDGVAPGGGGGATHMGLKGGNGARGEVRIRGVI